MKKKRLLCLFSVVLLLSMFAAPWACCTPAPEELQILSLYAAAESDTSVTVNWATDRPATGRVEYGTDTTYGTASPADAPDHTVDTNLSVTHSITLTGLTAGVDYYYQVTSVDADDMSATDTGTFNTLDLTIFGVSVTTVSDTSVTVSWSTDKPASSQVEYGATTSYGTSTAEVTTLTRDHSVTLTGLTPGSTYHYIAKSTDADGVSDTSDDATFNTTGLVISAVAATPKSNKATITWTTDDASSSQVEYGTTTAYGSTTTVDVTGVTSHSVVLTDLTPSTEYNYRVKSASSTDDDVSANKTFTTAAPARLTVGVTEVMGSLNPFAANGTQDIVVMSRIYEPLLINNENGEVEPRLAASWTWDLATLTYTFNLDPDAVWSDGQPVTADDVKFSYDQSYLNDTSSAGDTKSFLPQTGGVVDDDAVTVVNDTTVTFTLTEENRSFLNDMSGVYIVPEHIWEPIRVAQEAKDPAETIVEYANVNPAPVGSGAFLWHTYVEDQYVLMERNPDYWDGAANIDELVFQIFGSEEAAVLALKAGDIDVMNDVSLYTQVAGLVADSDIEVGIDETANFFTLLYMNHRTEPLNLVAFREALDLAIDRIDMIAFAVHGYGSIAPLAPFVPAAEVNPDVLWPGIGVADQDRIDDANTILDAIPGMSAIGAVTAGVRTYDPPGAAPAFDLEFALKTNNAPDRVRGAEVIRDSLAEVGVKLNVETMGTFPVVLMLFLDGVPDNWDFAYFGHGAVPGFQGLAQEFGADPYSQWYDSGAIGWGDDGAGGGTAEALAAQALLRDVRRETNLTELATKIQEAQVLFADELPIITGFQSQLVYAYRTDRFTGWNPTDQFDGFGSSGFLCSTPNLTSIELK